MWAGIKFILKNTRKSAAKAALARQAEGIDVLTELAALKAMTVIELQARWRVMFEEPPPHASRGNLELRIGYRIQELAHGGIKPATRRTLDTLATEVAGAVDDALREQWPHTLVATSGEAVGLLDLSLAAMAGMVADSGFDTGRMRKAAEAGHATATDLADWLVRQADIPFREAHHITGAAVKLADEKGVALDGLSIDDLKGIDARIDERVFDALSVDASVAARASYGGTAPVRVREQVAAAKQRLGMEE